MRWDISGGVWWDGKRRCLLFSRRTAQMSSSSSPCVVVESCCAQSVSTSPHQLNTAPYPASSTQPLTSVNCVLGCSRTRSRPAAGHLDSAGMSRCLPVKCGCRGFTCGPPPVRFSTRPRWRRQNTCTVSAVQHAWGRRGTASSSLLRQRPPSSRSWPITTSGDSSGEPGPDATRTGFLTQGAGPWYFSAYQK